MHVTMVKKRLASGEPCRKCVQAEELLKSRGLWNRIDEVVWADENDPSSPGMLLGARLGARLGIALAPFFVVREDDGAEKVYESVLHFIKERLDPRAAAAPSGASAGAALPPANSGGANTRARPSAIDAIDVERAARELEGKHPSEILRWGLERWGASLGIAFSGAEDVVLLHMATELRLPFSVFSLDTGRLHPETYRFIDSVRKRYGVDIALMAPEAAPLEALVKKKGLFSFYDDGHGECCGVRKIAPLKRALSGFAAWVTGQRRDQSPATRSAIAAVERDAAFAGAAGTGGAGGAGGAGGTGGVDGVGTLIKLNPLAAWTSADTWTYIRENSIPYNPLHERGFVSIGCEPCTRAILPGEHERAGRWWWEESTKRECGLHIGNLGANGTNAAGAPNPR
jgi:phosphoadenosine phosphosulfate reductase